MTASEIGLIVAILLLIFVPCIVAFVYAVKSFNDEFSTRRQIELENKSLERKLDKEISRLRKNSRKLEIKKRQHKESSEDVEEKQAAIAAEIKSLESLKLAIIKNGIENDQEVLIKCDEEDL